MPSGRVSGNEITLNRFDVVGQDETSGFIRHTGLAAREGQQSRQRVEVYHMRPPLRKDPGEMQADAQGTANLTHEEACKIQNFIDRHAGEHEATQSMSLKALLAHAAEIYCIYPHATPYEEENGRYARTRFSCAGFVLEAYKRARISLVDVSSVPKVDLEKLKQSYPDFTKELDNPLFRKRMGLSGTGGWPVLLCGYLFHALYRSDSEIRKNPYVARSGDESFGILEL